MDIGSLNVINSDAIRTAYQNSTIGAMIGQTQTRADKSQDVFGAFLDAAIKDISQTNAYLSDAENEKIRFAIGEAENSHDLTIAMQKASAALDYTIAIRDKFLEAYKEIMQMQI